MQILEGNLCTLVSDSEFESTIIQEPIILFFKVKGILKYKLERMCFKKIKKKRKKFEYFGLFTNFHSFYLLCLKSSQVGAVMVDSYPVGLCQFECIDMSPCAERQDRLSLTDHLNKNRKYEEQT